ncbi:MAG: hypothetical protein JRG73_21195 [Deltaproteobacteria bacterium]|nr:hypothetical protein [Deltaproteobacteria bacterium]
MRVAILPGVVKPGAVSEATGICNRRALRGDGGRRVLKDWPRNLGGPAGSGPSHNALGKK